MKRALDLGRHWTMHRAGRRGAFLAFLALLDILYGYSLVAAAPREQLGVDLLLPWAAWGGIWIGVGVICASGIVMYRDRFQYAVAAALKFVWSGVWVDIWLTSHLPRGWVSVVVWAAFGAVVLVVAGWPDVKVRGNGRDSI